MNNTKSDKDANNRIILLMFVILLTIIMVFILGYKTGFVACLNTTIPQPIYPPLP